MPIEKELFVKAQDYLDGRLGINDLYVWVMDREPHWSEPPDKHSAARVLVGAIELSCWEFYDGHRDEKSVRQIIADEIKQLTASTPLL